VEAQEIIHKEDTHSITTPNMGIILQNSTNKCGPIIRKRRLRRLRWLLSLVLI
jgi:hypothetical protein